jgi:hypothetical protein
MVYLHIIHAGKYSEWGAGKWRDNIIDNKIIVLLCIIFIILTDINFVTVISQQCEQT